MSLNTLKCDMEDFLITLQCNFVDTETGEVLTSTQFSLPMSIIRNEPLRYTRYFDSFFRGVFSGRKLAMSITLVNDRDLPQVVQSSLCF